MDRRVGFIPLLEDNAKVRMPLLGRKGLQATGDGMRSSLCCEVQKKKLRDCEPEL